VSRTFKNYVVCDFEYEVADGDLPVPLCMVAYIHDENFRLIKIIKVWRNEFGSTPPFDIGPRHALHCIQCVGRNDMLSCARLEIPGAHLRFAYRVFIHQQHPVALRTGRGSKEAAQAAVGRLPNVWPRRLERDRKGDIVAAIGNGTWRERYSPQDVMDYCEEDDRMEADLFLALLCGTYFFEPADPQNIMYWSEYGAKAVARIQARGMPIDLPLWHLVQENKAAVISALLQKYDPSYGSPCAIYSPEGEWAYDRFAQWLSYIGALAWPRLKSGQLDISSDAFKLMYGTIPGIENLHALRDSIGFIAKARLPIGRDGRNRPSLFPFGTTTGRNAHARSPFNAHASMRSFMQFPPGSVGFYLDWRSQEVGLAAALSNDPQLKADYAAGDIYHALAVMCGLTNEPDPKRWKKEQGVMRDRMKPLQLGINYGMGVPSLARGLNRHALIASEIILRHKRRYPVFWQWRADQVQHAMFARRIESVGGWPLRITHEPNERTLYNFPMQSGGAEMLRLAVVRLVDAGIIPIMLVHDGILFEETDPEKIAIAMSIMQDAGREICDGFEIGVDLDRRIESGDHYRDRRGEDMWKTIMDTLITIGALKKKDVA
jgi:hypothetical protein